MFRLYTDPEDSGFQQSSFRQNKSILRTGQEEGEGSGCPLGTIYGPFPVRRRRRERSRLPATTDKKMFWFRT